MNLWLDAGAIGNCTFNLRPHPVVDFLAKVALVYYEWGVESFTDSFQVVMIYSTRLTQFISSHSIEWCNWLTFKCTLLLFFNYEFSNGCQIISDVSL